MGPSGWLRIGGGVSTSPLLFLSSNNQFSSCLELIQIATRLLSAFYAISGV